MVEKIKSFFTKDNVIALAFTFLFLFSIYAFNGKMLFINASNHFSTVYYSIILSILVLGTGALLFVLYKNDKLKKNSLMGLVFPVLIIIGIIIILTTESNMEFIIRGSDGVINTSYLKIDSELRTYYVLSFIGEMFSIYLITMLIDKCISMKFIHYVCVGVVAFVTVACIISYFKDFEGYKRFLTFNFDSYFAYAPESIFGHRNTFGLFLFIGMFNNFISYSVSKKKFYLYYNFYFLVMLMFTISKTQILATFILWVLFYSYMFITTYKEHKKRNLIILGVTVLLAVIGIVVLIITHALDKLFNSHGEGFFASLESRFIIWDKVGQVLSSRPQNMIFGLGGFHLVGDVLLSVNNADLACHANWDVDSCHNLYVQALASGGIILLTVAIIGLAYFIYRSIKLYKVDKLEGYTLLSIVITFIVFCMFEG